MPELWPHVFEAFDGVEAILHAGDIHDIRVIDQLHEVAPTYAARGNGDDGSSGREVQPDDDRLKEVWLLKMGGFNIGLTHYIPMPELPPNLTVSKWIDRLYPEQRPDVLIYGDTHVEQIDVFDGVLCVNPGSPTFPHNLSTQLGTIGFLDLAGDAPEASIHQLTEDGFEPFDWGKWRRPW
jgi:putative phosphoesterase